MHELVINESTCSETGTPSRQCRCDACQGSKQTRNRRQPGHGRNSADDDIRLPLPEPSVTINNHQDDLVMNDEGVDDLQLPLPPSTASKNHRGEDDLVVNDEGDDLRLPLPSIDWTPGKPILKR